MAGDRLLTCEFNRAKIPHCPIPINYREDVNGLCTEALVSVRFQMTGRAREWLRHLKQHGIAITIAGLLESFVNGPYDHLKNEYYKRRIEETAEEVGEGLFVGGESRVNSRTVLGDNVHFMGMHVRGEGSVTIGDNFHSGSGCEIMTENHNYEGEALPYDDTYIRKSVEIGDNVWFGIGVMVIPGVTIGEGAIIQSKSVVTTDIPRGAIAGGHPAEVFDERDMDHYERLKSQGKFN